MIENQKTSSRQKQAPYKKYYFARGIIYAMLIILVTTGYGLIVSGLGLLLNGAISPINPFIIGLIIFSLALMITPLHNSLSKLINDLFFRGEREFETKLQTLSNDLSGAVGMNEIIKFIHQYINRSFSPSILHVFIYDHQDDQYIAAVDEKGNTTSDLRFPVSSPTISLLTNITRPLVIKDRNLINDQNLQLDVERLNLMNAVVLVPLTGQERLAGWIALGNPASGDEYTERELRFLNLMSDQFALAIERAQVIANMEERVLEMNVLTRIAQGINITLTLDDILELIYAQSTQIVPADDFHIYLHDDEPGALQLLFCVEQNDRLRQLENSLVSAGHSLEFEIIQQRRPLKTDYYEKECQQRGLTPLSQDIFAWISVPLNAGAETIGVLSLGSRLESRRYTLAQLSLLQAIADQVAGAIVKARLLEETQKRERLLISLNAVSRQLASTLALEPLLQNIMQSATDILNCEAGSLLQVDEHTGELVFQVATGPVSKTLIGRRIPPGDGLVGKSVKMRKSVMVNNVKLSQEWFPIADQETGFNTRAVLVVPMELKERVVGAIEVINKKDGSSFTRDDQEFLTAFAAQAVIAIENARLYTMTDMALAARVEELSILQRIGRDLNASLDITKAMTITLEWAIRQSGGEAGLIGIIENGGLQVMANQGCETRLSQTTDNLLPLSTFNLQEIVDTGMVRNSIPLLGQSILENCQSQIVIPIQREDKSIGLLLLEREKAEMLGEDNINFLLRLSDQASTAISNAQLYLAVQNANIAKSEFVSFVSHELKNPMTSIKGYTELLAAGAVGPVSEAQANFLGTIKSNVERMATLVSDLADVSRIEANRLKLDFKPQKSLEIMEEISRSLRKQIDEKKIELEINIPADLPDVWADRTRLSQALTNLISNAYKYTPSGGKIIVTAISCINQWDVNGAPKVIHYQIRDNGIGIGLEDQKKIFQKFFRSEDPKTRELPGTGLGLNITKSLVELQGGIIWFESEFREGTTFHFIIPVAA